MGALRMGRCYEWAFTELFESAPEGTVLKHAIVDVAADVFPGLVRDGHAWLEYPDGTVADWQMVVAGHDRPKEAAAFEALIQPVDVVEYDRVAALAEAERTMVYGPWVGQPDGEADVDDEDYPE